MRFVLSLSLFALLSIPASAAPWDIVPLADSGNTPAPTRSVQMQHSGSAKTLKTIDTLDLEILASGLGSISALALGDDGTLFTTDQKSGRIWALTDRGQDGSIDLRRPLPFIFESPTGLAVIGSTFYVADQNAVWVIEKGQQPKELASLKHANAIPGSGELFLSSDDTSLILGLTTQNQGFRILALDRITGQASLVSEDNNKELHSLAQIAHSKIWAASGPTFGPLGDKSLKLTPGQSISAIALPGQYETPQDWPAHLSDHIIASHLGPKAMQLIAIPTEFGQISGSARVVVEGFLTRSGRNAWGRPGPIVMDERGLFFADTHNGTIWRLSPAPKAQSEITRVETSSVLPKPSPEPNLASKGALKIGSSIKGTQIDASSTIIKPSSIEYGSKLIKDYDEKKALEYSEKADGKPRKKRRMSRKRKQKDNK